MANSKEAKQPSLLTDLVSKILAKDKAPAEPINCVSLPCNVVYIGDDISCDTCIHRMKCCITQNTYNRVYVRREE